MIPLCYQFRGFLFGLSMRCDLQAGSSPLGWIFWTIVITTDLRPLEVYCIG